MINVNNLTKIKDGKLIINNLNFTIEYGKTVGILGVKGSGKSLALNMITGYIPFSKGNVKICDFDLKSNPIMAKKQFGYMPQDLPLYEYMTVKSYLNFVFDLKDINLDKNSHILDICELVGLQEEYNKIIKNLSFDKKKYVSLAQALLGNPNILILDNPTMGLSENQISKLQDKIKYVSNEKTLIMSTNKLKNIQSICTHVIVMDKGKIIANEETEEILKVLSGTNQYIIEVKGSESIIYNILKNVSGVSRVKKLEGAKSGSFKYIIESGYHIDIRMSVVNSMESAGLKIIDFHKYKRILKNVLYQITNRNNIEDVANSIFDITK